jgi:hypothetical protein
MSEHTHVFCPGCREDSDTLAARDQSIAASQEIATELFDVVEAAGAATPELQRRVRERLAAIGGQPATPDPRDEQIATLREGLAQASEAVAHLLDLYNPDGLDDPGPNIPSDLLRWRALLPPPAADPETQRKLDCEEICTFTGVTPCAEHRARANQKPAAEGGPIERPCLDCGTLLPRESSAVRCMDCVEKAQIAHWMAAEGEAGAAGNQARSAVSDT